MTHKRVSRKERWTLVRAAVSGFASGTARVVASWLLDQFVV